MNEAEVPGGILPDPDAAGGAARPLIPVVGIGASAGGLQGFKRLLRHLPVDTGFAIVFIQQFDPRHHSLLAEILARATAMPVTEATHGLPVEANHVYVIPENVDLTIEAGSLMLFPRTQMPGSHMNIDLFLRSVANQCGSRAIGVILSGTGSDGPARVEAIKAAGGVTFAEDAASAKFATMPQSPLDTGCVDFVLPPESIAAELARIGRHPYIAEALPSHEEEPQGDDDGQFASILAILHKQNGFRTLRVENSVRVPFVNLYCAWLHRSPAAPSAAETSNLTNHIPERRRGMFDHESQSLARFGQRRGIF